ncbi:MAG: hypothetical protein ACI96N_003506, partial [Arenicella sp.]
AKGRVDHFGSGVSWAPKTPPARTSIVPALKAKAWIKVNNQTLLGIFCTNQFPCYLDVEISVLSVTIYRILFFGR